MKITRKLIETILDQIELWLMILAFWHLATWFKLYFVLCGLLVGLALEFLLPIFFFTDFSSLICLSKYTQILSPSKPMSRFEMK